MQTDDLDVVAVRAKAMLDAKDYEGAAREGSRALDTMLPGFADIAVVQGRALLLPLLDRARHTKPGERLDLDVDEAYDKFNLALTLDKDNKDAAHEIEKLEELLKCKSKKELLKHLGVVLPDDAKDDHDHDGAAHDGAAHNPKPQATAGELDPKGAAYDVVIVGAGAAGIGCAITLTSIFGLEPGRVLLLERGEGIGTSFRKWPEEMKFISPSFNQYEWTNSFDLNSVAFPTSPAYSLHAEHPSGEQYADYLTWVAEVSKLQVKLRTEVISTVRADGVFDVCVRNGGDDGQEETLRARFVVWAAGEFQYPNESSESLAGAELCVHNSRVRSWAELQGDGFVVIGGYESGVDAAVNLANAGKQSTVLASTATWNIQTEDPSSELAPYTAERLRQVTAAGFAPRPKLLAPLRVQRVERAQKGGYNVVATWKAAEPAEFRHLRKPLALIDDAADSPAEEGGELVVHTTQPPVLCTGFEGSVKASARNLFNLADDSDGAKGCLAGAPLLTNEDESTKVPGVFLVGPSVRHGELSFCFIYKFRQRFGIVADAICRRLGRDTTRAVKRSREMNMYLDDFVNRGCGSCGGGREATPSWLRSLLPCLPDGKDEHEHACGKGDHSCGKGAC